MSHTQSSSVNASKPTQPTRRTLSPIWHFRVQDDCGPRRSARYSNRCRAQGTRSCRRHHVAATELCLHCALEYDNASTPSIYGYICLDPPG
jgi:hypothetical protein